ncbi:hypothetical protein OESDEN_11008 [Oesophagostomum dentatum]|uniref:G-protein coupled receptors family 1 profile domain-containing protein n=1 Tax=Oesophagostomum dentatum TaxID=61180 RepID=A0A0B1SZ66_OESDE|nr:hypothetical protein OESDEN_11008 [Oesophagostomum dentatum]
MSSVLFVKGGVQMPCEPGRILLMAWIVLLCVSIIVSPCHFIFRYLQLCRRNFLLICGKRIFYIFLVPALFSLSAAVMLIFSAYPSKKDVADFEEIAYSINLDSYKPFLVASLHSHGEEDDETKAKVLVAACVNLAIILLWSLLTMLICWRLMVEATKIGESTRTIYLHRQLQKLLLIQVLAFSFVYFH